MLRNHTRLPTKWIHQGGLRKFGLLEVWGLKALLGLAIMWGRFERQQAARVALFPASLTDLSEVAHLSRNAALEGVRQLVQRGLVEQVRGQGAALGAHRRTSSFRFTDPEMPYFPFPHFHVDDSGLLGDMRRGQASLAALKVYLMLGAFRDRSSGGSSLSYDKMQEYSAVHRTFIRRGVSLLIEHGVLTIAQGTGRTRSHYYLLGLDRAHQSSDRPSTSLLD